MCSDTLETQRFDSCGKGAEEDAVGFTKNVSRFSMRVPNTWGPLVGGLAFPENGLALRQDLAKVGKTLVDWERGIVYCVLIEHLQNLSIHSCN